MINEVVNQILPVVQTLADRYKPRDVISGLLIVAFDMQLGQDKDAGKALNNFRALSDTAARSRLGKPA